MFIAHDYSSYFLCSFLIFLLGIFSVYGAHKLVDVLWRHRNYRFITIITDNTNYLLVQNNV